MQTQPSKLCYYIATTLDGYIADPDGSYEGLLMGGEHVASFLDYIQRASAVLMGRKTYQSGLDAGLPLGQPAYPGRPNYVFSRTLRLPADQGPHQELEIVDHDPVTFVTALKEQIEGEVWLCGGGQLASPLLDAGLVDELILKINPVLFGQGRALVAGLRANIEAELVDTTVYDNGLITAHYRLSSR